MPPQPQYKTPEDMQAVADAYFDSTPHSEWTITGLCIALDLTRQGLINYENKPAFVDTVKKIKQRVEWAYETSLRKNGRSGDIFALKNFGWKDKTETELSGPDGGPIDHSVKIEFVD